MSDAVNGLAKRTGVGNRKEYSHLNINDREMGRKGEGTAERQS